MRNGNGLGLTTTLAPSPGKALTTPADRMYQKISLVLQRVNTPEFPTSCVHHRRTKRSELFCHTGRNARL